MPYQKHPAFAPVGEGTLIWRYIDFTKLVSMLAERALFFCRSDLLEDRFEGSISRASLRLRDALAPELPPEQRDRMWKQLSEFRKTMPKRTFINAWSMGRYESVALWRLFVGDRDGVAIRSTFGRLTQSLGAYEKPIFVGSVNYIDYDVDPIPEGNMLHPFVCKRKSFDYERELRAVIQDLAVGSEPGLQIPCDLDVLVTAIRVSPASDSWFVALVSSVLKTYGLKVPVEQSDLLDEPVY